MRAATGVSGSTGWCMYCLVVAEVVLACLGWFSLLRNPIRNWVIPGGVICFVLLDLYASHFVLIPYYSGLIMHKPNGLLAAFHISQIRQVGIAGILQRIELNKPDFMTSPVIVISWMLYLICTVGLALLSFRACVLMKADSSETVPDGIRR
jgi:hypothetical protein